MTAPTVLDLAPQLADIRRLASAEARAVPSSALYAYGDVSQALLINLLAFGAIDDAAWTRAVRHLESRTGSVVAQAEGMAS